MTKSNDKVFGFETVVKKAVTNLEERYTRKSFDLLTGLKALDLAISGLTGGCLYVITGRPSMGKTALLTNMAADILLRQKKSVLFVTADQRSDMIAQRMVASEAKISTKELTSGKMRDETWPRYIAAAGAFADSKLQFFDQTWVAISEIEEIINEFKPDVLMVDKFHSLIEEETPKEGSNNRINELNQAAINLKRVAKEYDIPVITICDMNKSMEARTDRRPLLTDMKEFSGSLESYADVILGLYRNDYYDMEDPEHKGKADILVLKSKDGPKGDVRVQFDLEYLRFADGELHVFSPVPPPQAPPQNFKRPKNFAPGNIY